MKPYLDDADIAPEVEGCIREFWKIANRSNRAGCRRMVRSTRGVWLAGRLVGWLYFQGATSCLREYGRERTQQKRRYRLIRRSRKDSALLPERLCKIRHQRTSRHQLVPTITRRFLSSRIYIVVLN